MTEKTRKISFSETPRIRSYSTSDPVHRDVGLAHRISDLRLKRVSDAEPAYRRYSESCKPDLSRIHRSEFGAGDSPASPRHLRNSKSRTSGGMSPVGNPAKKDKSLEANTVDRYITSIVQICSNEALASHLDPPPKGSDEYERVLEELKDM